MIRAVVPTGLDAFIVAVGRALDGSGPPVAPAPALASRPASPPGTRPGTRPADAVVPGSVVPGSVAPGSVARGAVVPDGTALVLRTSGSTGAPREVILSAEALRASGTATSDRLGGPGHWLLTLPADHVAGVQVVARAHVAGRGLTVAPDGAFTAEGFAAASARAERSADGSRRYVSLVPTQLHRLIAAADAGNGVGLDALAGFDAVLVGGAATPPALLARARSAGARVVTTYGMTETCGGCVYDGVPLDGVRVRLAAGTPGVVELSGPVLATGYLGRPAETAAAFRTDPDGSRWFRTSDLGVWSERAPGARGPSGERAASGPRAPGARGPSGERAPEDERASGNEPGGGRRLRILGRADEVVVTGGVNVVPAAVEAVVAGVPGVEEVCVVGVPDPEWGQAVVAVVTRADPPGASVADGTLFAEVRRRVTDTLGRAAAPRRVLVVPDLPRRGPGKVDRAAVARDVVGLDVTPATPHD